MKIKKDDTVLIISGKDRGRKGKVFRVFPKQKKVMVEGINIIKKHIRPKRSGQKGQIIELPAALSVSNLKLLCSKCNKAVKVGYKIIDKKKVRLCKKCGKET